MSSASSTRRDISPDDETEESSNELAMSMNDRIKHRESRRQQAHQPRDCAVCETEYTPDEGFSHRHCSRSCYYRSLATDLIANVTYDHRFCGSCYRRWKEIEPPGRLHSLPADFDPESDEFVPYDAIPDCAIGRQFYIPYNTQEGQGEILTIHYDGDASGADDSSDPDVSDLIIRRRVCVCGVTHHSTISRPKHGFDTTRLLKHVSRLCDVLNEHYEEGRMHQNFSIDAFYDKAAELKRSGEDHRQDQPILEEALGFAVANPHYSSD